MDELAKLHRDQVWGWWVKGLGGLINIGVQICARFGPPPSELKAEIKRLQELVDKGEAVESEGIRSEVPRVAGKST